VHAVYDLAPVIADIIASHHPGSSERKRFLRACLAGEWNDAQSIVDGMLADPMRLRGFQENRLREFRDLLPGHVEGDKRGRPLS